MYNKGICPCVYSISHYPNQSASRFKQQVNIFSDEDNKNDNINNDISMQVFQHSIYFCYDSALQSNFYYLDSPPSQDCKSYNDVVMATILYEPGSSCLYQQREAPLQHITLQLVISLLITSVPMF